jgi:hypothetical protein
MGVTMAKRGELKPMDEFEETIRDCAVAYNVVGFKPGSNSKVYATFKLLWAAQAYAQDLIKQPLGLRCLMIYAIDEHDHHALVCTVNQFNQTVKMVEPKRY